VFGRVQFGTDKLGGLRMTDAIGELPEMVSIGQLAKATGVSSRTIRYYEELGILPEPRRSPGGARKYPQEYQKLIGAALTLKDLGFRLEQIKPLTRLMLGKVLTPAQRTTAAQLVDGRLDELGLQVAMLHKLRESVRRSGREATARVPEVAGRGGRTWPAPGGRAFRPIFAGPRKVNSAAGVFTPGRVR
jgi:DNA-binding transcriptional MerR regulator